MKKQIFSILLAGLLLLAATGCANDKEDYIARLEDENAQLRSQVEALTSQLQVLGENVGLVNWDLQVQAWNSGSGATVTFTGTPALYAQEQSATFTVWLEGEEVASVPCLWDGTAYTASAELDAADGYCYYCHLTTPGGKETEVEINTPNNTTDESLINMQTSLAAYAGLVVEDWEHVEDHLTVISGYGQVQLPQLSGESSAVCTAAELSFRLNGQELHRQSVALPEEAGSTLHLDLAGKQFPVPEMENDYQLDLWLEVTLSDGRQINAVGASWFLTDGALTMSVG